MFLYIVMLLLSLALAAIFTLRRSGKTDEISLLLKTASSMAFVMLGCVSFRYSHGAISLALIPGLVFGLIGDVYLDLKYVYPRKAVFYTFVGFGAFILGHLCYMIFLFTQYPLTVAGLIIALVIGALGGAVIYLTPEKMKVNYGRFHVISAAYGALLIFLTVYALSLCFVRFTGAKVMFFLGILLFLISDLILSQIYFGQNKNTPGNSILNHASYYLGQILIAASMMAL